MGDSDDRTTPDGRRGPALLGDRAASCDSPHMYLPCVSTDPRLVLGYHKEMEEAMTRKDELIQTLSDSGEDPARYDLDAILTALAAAEQDGEVDAATYWCIVGGRSEEHTSELQSRP